ncbi:MAG: putative Ig domain-containing protein, partial [Acidobacteriaceae bacterium]|nr:putative Ig domain-containing protein [Acidobacteriaceae bacterium]
MMRWSVAGAMILALAALCGPMAQAQTAARYAGIVSTLNYGGSQPRGVAVDSSGNVFVADHGGVYEIENQSGCMSTDPSSCTTRQLASGFSFTSPQGVAVDNSGNVFVADGGGGGGGVYEIPYTSATDTYATSPISLGSGFSQPFDVAVDSSGNVFVADSNNGLYVIRASCISNGTSTTGSGCTIQLLSGSSMYGVTVDSGGNLYYTDGGVREIPSSCVSDSISAGTLMCSPTRLSSSLSSEWPDAAYGLAVDSSGNVFAAMHNTRSIFEILGSCIRSGTSTNHGCAFQVSGGFGSTGQFYGMAMDGSGSLYVAKNIGPLFYISGYNGVDFGAVPVATTTSPTVQLTFAFTAGGKIGYPPMQVLTMGAAYRDFTEDWDNEYLIPGTCANGYYTSYSYSAGETCTMNITFTPKFAGPRNGAVNLAAADNTTVIATALVHGIGTGPQAVFNAPLPVTLPTLGASGEFSRPYDVAVNGNGDIFVADEGHGAVKKISVGCPTCAATTLSTSGDFSVPSSVAVDGAGNIYVADQDKHAVKMIAAGCTGTCPSITLNSDSTIVPIGVTVDGSGNVYFTDQNTSDPSVKMIAAGCTGACPSTTLSRSGDFRYPERVAVDGTGNIYVTEQNGNSVRKIAAGCTGACAFTTLSTDFTQPAGVAVDGAGNIYVAEFSAGLGAVKQIAAGCTSLCPATALGRSGDFSQPMGMTLDAAGNIYVADYDDGTVKEISRAQPPLLTFPATAVDETSASSNGPAILQNIGTDALNFTLSVEAATTASAPFTIASSGSNPCGTTLASSDTCAFDANFAPTAPGGFVGMGTVTSNNLNATDAKQQLMMIGISPVLLPETLPPAGYHWPYSVTLTAVGMPGDPYTFAADNLPSWLTLDPATGVLSASSPLFGTFNFTVTATDTIMALLGGSPNTVTRQYTLVVSELVGLTSSLNPSTTDDPVTFTAALVASSTGDSVAFKDNGTDISGCESVGIVLGGPAGHMATCQTTALAAGVHNITAVYNPTPNNPNVPTATFALAQVVNPAAVGGASCSSANFGSVAMGQSLTCVEAVTIPATGAADASGAAVLTLGAPNLDFTVDASMPVPASLACSAGKAYAAGDTCYVAVKFAPKFAGARNGAVTLTDSTTGTTLAAAFITGIGTGPQAVFNSPLPATLPTLGSGFSMPWGAAVDGAGNVYVADTYNNAVKLIPYSDGSGTPVQLSSNIYIGQPFAVAVDGAGNVYVADNGNGAVMEIQGSCIHTASDPSTCPAIQLGVSIPYISGVAVDGAGNVYATSTNSGPAHEIQGSCIRTATAPSTCPATSLGGGFVGPYGLAVDGAGNVYVADYPAGTVNEILGSCISSGTSNTDSANCVVPLGSGFDGPNGPAVDGAGNVYVANYNSGEV